MATPIKVLHYNLCLDCREAVVDKGTRMHNSFKFLLSQFNFFRAHLALTVLELLFRAPYNYFVRAKCNDKLAHFQADVSVDY